MVYSCRHLFKWIILQELPNSCPSLSWSHSLVSPVLDKIVDFFSKYVNCFFIEMSRPFKSACYHSGQFSCDNCLGQKLEHCLYLSYWLGLPPTPLLPLPENQPPFPPTVSNHSLLACEGNIKLHKNVLLSGKSPRNPSLALNWSSEVIFWLYSNFFLVSFWSRCIYPAMYQSSHLLL